MIAPTRGRLSRLSRLTVATAAALAVVALPSTARADVTSKPARTWGTNGQVSVMLPVGDRIYLGGSFTTVIDPSGVSYPAKNLAVVSATTGAADLGFAASTDTGTTTKVTALATDGSSLFVGGTFNRIDGVARNNLAAVNLSTGALVAGFVASASANVDSLTVAGGALYAGGIFSSIRAGNGVTSQPYVAKLNPGSGAVDATWTAAPDDRVRALVPAADGSGRIFLGGDFTTVSGVTSRRVVAVTASGAVDPTFKPGANNGSAYATVYDLAADSTHLYAAVGGSGGACTAYNSGAAGSSTGTVAWSDHSDGNMQSVRLLGRLVYCGGHFGGTTAFTGQPRQKLAAVNASDGTLTAFAPQINSPLGVWSLATGGSRLFVGGDFTSVSGVPQPHFAEFPDISQQGPPAAPGLFAQPGSAVVHLSWTAPSTDNGAAVTKYKIYRTATAGSIGTALTTVTSTTRTYDDAAVSNGTTYYYQLVALNSLGAGAASNQAAATPDASITPSAPGAPIGLTAANPAGYTSLSWNPPTDNGGSPVTTYNVYRGTSPGAESRYASTTSTAYRDTGIVAGVTYYYVVTAVNSAGLEGPASSEDYTTAQPGLPGAPTLTATAGTHQVQLTWTVPSDGGTAITGYVVMRNNVRLKTVASSSTSFVDSTAASGTSYTYQVAAINAQGRGQLSNKATVTPS